MTDDPRTTDDRPDAMRVCGEAYQAVGLLANMAGVFNDPAVQALLDNLSNAANGTPLTHESVLPFYPAGWRDKITLSETKPSIDWQPIQSAPRKPYKFGWRRGPLLWLLIPYDESQADVGAWDIHAQCFRFFGDDGPQDIQPTHWMPLPEPSIT